MTMLQSPLKLMYTAIIIVGIAACTGALDAGSYTRWVQDYGHGLHVRKASGDHIYDLQYQPADYVALQRMEGSLDKARYEQVKTEVSKLQYYTLTIEVADGKSDFISYQADSEEMKQDKLYYFSYGFQNDIHLNEGGELLPCVLLHFERAIDLKPGRTFVLGFENPETETGKSTLVIASPRLSGEPVNIEILKDDIPALAL